MFPLAVVAADWADFASIRDRIGLSDSARRSKSRRSKRTGHVVIERPVSERRRRVRARLTPLGRKRLAAHAAALQGIIAVGDAASQA